MSHSDVCKPDLYSSDFYKIVSSSAARYRILTVSGSNPQDFGSAHVDQISFTVDLPFSLPSLDDVDRFSDDFLSPYSKILSFVGSTYIAPIFGLCIGLPRSGGSNFYSCTHKIIHPDDFFSGVDCPRVLGLVSFGGQRNTANVQIYAQGIELALEGWQERFYRRAKDTKQFNLRISRIDLAHDDFEGSKGLLDVVDFYRDGLFSSRGTKPKIKIVGPHPEFPSDEGTTIYIGKRENGKMLRAYEKGKQLGDKNSKWVRFEVELHNKDRIVPLEAVIYPERYLSGAYLALCFISEMPEKIEVTRNIVQKKITKSIYFARRCYGKVINLLKDVGFSNDSIVSLISRRDEYPDYFHSGYFELFDIDRSEVSTDLFSRLVDLDTCCID